MKGLTIKKHIKNTGLIQRGYYCGGNKNIRKGCGGNVGG
jgi:hypothetical protein